MTAKTTPTTVELVHDRSTAKKERFAIDAEHPTLQGAIYVTKELHEAAGSPTKIVATLEFLS